METKIKGDRKKQLESIADSFEAFLREGDKILSPSQYARELHRLNGYCQQLRIIASEFETKKEESKEDKRLSQHMYNSEQSWHYKSIWNFMGKKLSVQIKRNAYDFQSYQCVSIFNSNTNGWNRLLSLPVNEASNCFPISYVHRDADIKLFEKDEAELLKQAALILK